MQLGRYERGTNVVLKEISKYQLIDMLEVHLDVVSRPVFPAKVKKQF
jgi:hypothetical protein